MIKIYAVFIKCGFCGVKYFQNEKYANDFAKENNESVDILYATAKEYCSTDFSDPLIIE